MTAPAQIIALIERFDRNRDAYLSAQYNETQLRQEFINPFFETLGWDMTNKAGYAEAYKDVIHEDAIKVGGATKAPDYCFRIGGARKFFLEAKKPSINIKEDVGPAFQLRRYAYSAKLPLSILSDFEEFAVYDCRLRPVKTDKASAGRTLYLKYAEYPDRWDEIESKFSREAVLKGYLDKYVESTRLKKGAAEVDDALLTEIEHWRDILAHNLALRNTKLSQRELNFAVQRTIDRIVFLRICEDRGVEIYGRLLALLNGPNIYRRLVEMFQRADEKYNSGLFHFLQEKDRAEEPDRLTPGLEIDDKVIKDIIGNLYYPDSPYEFSVMPADILGQVYEQFLGKVIRLTAGHRAVVESKPEVKKAGGVYYTPTYIVDYIVRQTVGKLLEGKTPKQADRLKILDPACGSGSFLIGAYQYLLDWRRDWYLNNATTDKGLKHLVCPDGSDTSSDKGLKPLVGRGGTLQAAPLRPRDNAPMFQAAGGEWRLTTAERKRILLNNIHGVDIDTQAVEVTKLSLLLKVLEGESEDSIANQRRFFHEQALPDLGNNIKCGNSLIGPDFYDNQQMSLLDDEEKYRINIFDWRNEFPEILKGDARNLWFITFVTHNSRISERMIKHEVKVSEPLVFAPDDQIFIAVNILKACARFDIPVVALNVLPDHVHMVLPATTEKELSEHIRKIKGYSSREFQKTRKIGPQGQVWAQKFNRKVLQNEDELWRAVEYVRNNHLKHRERWGERLVTTWEKGLKPILCPNDRPTSDKGFKPLVCPDSNNAPSDKGLKPLVCPDSNDASSDKGLKHLVSYLDAIKPDIGFDAVIGNPPYVRQETLGAFKDYFSEKYKTYHGMADLYTYFIEKAVNLLKEGGFFSYIVSNKWMRANYGMPLRKWLQGQSILHLIDFGDLPVFKTATTYPCILLITKGKTKEDIQACNVKTLEFKNLMEYAEHNSYPIAIKSLDPAGWSMATASSQKLLDKIKSAGVPLGKYVENKVYYGVKTGLNEAFVIDNETKKRLIKEDKKSAEIIKPFLIGKDVKRYQLPKPERFLIFFPKGWTPQNMSNNEAWDFVRDNYPAVADQLEPFKPKAEKRCDKGNFWWELRACDYYQEFEKPKIIFPDISIRGNFTVDISKSYSGNTTYLVPCEDYFLLSILNSKLLDFYYSNITTRDMHP